MSELTNEKMDKKLKGLRRFNLIMGFLHLVQGVFMFLISNDTTYPIYSNFLTFQHEHFFVDPGSKTLL